MEIKYDITVKDEDKNRVVSYWADSFSIDEYGILRIWSKDAGNIAVQLETNQRLTIHDVRVKDEGDELMEYEEMLKRNAENITRDTPQIASTTII